MSTAKPSLAVRFLPSATDVAFFMPIVFLFLKLDGMKHLLADGDTGWHIRTGDWILANGRVPDRDIFSFTKPGEPWFAWEWLWDVTFAWLHQHWGMTAVLLASLLVICLTYALLFRLVQRNCPNVLIAVAVTLVAISGSIMHWLARPHLFTLLFVVIFFSILERARHGRTRLLVALPLLMVPWTNIHGGFFVGIVLIGCYAAGELASWLLEPAPEQRKTALRRCRPYLFAGLACSLATLINPYTYHLHAHVYRFLSGSFHLQIIEEYQSTDFQSVLARWYEPMILFAVVAAAWSLYRKRYAHAFLALGWVHLALIAVRNVPIFMIVAAPIVALALHELVLLLAEAPVSDRLRRLAKDFTAYAAELAPLDRVPRLHAVSFAAFALVVAICFAPNPPPSFRAEYDPETYPAKALEVLRGPEFHNSIFTHDEWGDYLIYRLYPETRVFVDGRFDFYGARFVDKLVALMEVKFGWNETLDRYGVDTVLLPVDAPLTEALKESPRWRVVYDDGLAIVFRSAALPRRAADSRLSESKPSSVVASDSSKNRGLSIAAFQHRDPRITKSNTRSEPL